MLYTVTAVNENDEELEMRLTCPQFSGQNIYNIEGLGTPKADINTAQTATRDGSIYNSALCRERTISIHIKYVDSNFQGNTACIYPEDELGVCTDSYNDLLDKPMINSNVLVGDKRGDELGLQNEMDPIPIPTIEKLVDKYWGSI